MIKEVIADDVPATTPEAWRRQQQELLAESDRLYDTHVRPLEPHHWGKFVAVARDGRLVLSTSLDELTENAAKILGPGHFAFKVGDIAVVKVR